jgi:hypothetical protein
MKTVSRLVVFLTSIAFMPLARAAVDPGIVPADSLWLVYADLNSLRESVLGKELILIAQQAKFDTGQGQIGIDMQKALATVGTLTAYGANFSNDPKAIDGTVVLQGTADLRKIAESVLIQANLAHPEDVLEVTDLPFSAYAIRAHRQAGVPPLELIVAFPPEPVVIASRSRPHILRACEVIRHHAPSIANTPSAPLKDLLHRSEDAFVFSASVVPSDSTLTGEQPQMRILRMTQSGSIAVGEHSGNTFAHVELVAASDQSADKLMKIVQGFTAMLSLAETNDKQINDFINSAQVSREKNTVTLQAAYASDRLVEMIKRMNEQTSRPRPPTEGAAAAPVPASQLISGKALAQWTAEAVPAVASADGAKVPAQPAFATKTIEHVSLTTYSLITLGRAQNGGHGARFDRIEIVPEGVAGTPLRFRAEGMQTTGRMGNTKQLQFPGADGVYTLRVSYLNDPDGKAAYAVSVIEAAHRQPDPK